MKLHELGEFGLIERLRSRLKTAPGVLESIGDDAAILGALNTPVVTCDALIEDVHFRRDWTTPFLLGRKAMAVNLSDLAACGAVPIAAFVALGLSTPFAEEDGALAWLEALYDGFESAAGEHHFTLAGGDTTRTSREIMISITIIGEVTKESGKAGAPILRSGARAGDALLVTGNLGDSAAGLFLLTHPEITVSPPTRAFLLERHFNPTPRLREVRAALLAAQGSTPFSAALDLSDGLAGDAAHIAARSQLQLQIETATLPISAACREAANAAREMGLSVGALEWALSGGEDYELLMCVAPDTVDAVTQAMQRETGTTVTRIGHAFPQASPAVQFLDAAGNLENTPRAWTHF